MVCVRKPQINGFGSGFDLVISKNIRTRITVSWFYCAWNKSQLLTVLPLRKQLYEKWKARKNIWDNAINFKVWWNISNFRQKRLTFWNMKSIGNFLTSYITSFMLYNFLHLIQLTVAPHFILAKLVKNWKKEIFSRWYYR